MRSAKLKIIKYLGLIFVLNIAYSQKEISIPKDSLKNKTYDYLFERIVTFYDNDKQKTKLYLSAYLHKSKKDKDSLKMLRSYYLLADLADYKKSLKIIDTALKINKLQNQKEDAYWNVRLYILQGGKHYIKGKYNISVDSYLKAKDNIDKNTNAYFILSINSNIGVLKWCLGDYAKSIKFHQSTYDKLKKNNLRSVHSDIHLENLMSLTIGHRHLKQMDSATYYAGLTITESKKQKSFQHLYKAKINLAQINFEKKKYQKSLDTLLKYAPKVNDTIDLAITRMFTGKAYLALNKTKNAISEFKKVDTLLSLSENYPLQVRGNYSLLYSIYKKQKVLDTQLLYLEKLINFDSILYSNNTYVNTTLLNEYEIPNLINEKESLIKKLKYNDNKKSKQVSYLIILLVSVSSLTVFFYYKRFQYKKRFNAILEKKFPEKEIDQKKERKKLTVPQNIVSDIRVKLEKFEQENEFLDRSISLNKLAIIVGTNSNYLSKIINHYKNQNFSSYLNQLRIQYAIQKIKEDTQFRKYDIKSIAQEVGFNSAESFSKAFYKQTGIYPSYFIKQLNKSS